MYSMPVRQEWHESLGFAEAASRFQFRTSYIYVWLLLVWLTTGAKIWRHLEVVPVHFVKSWDCMHLLL
jgi:hypothetical protein